MTGSQKCTSVKMAEIMERFKMRPSGIRRYWQDDDRTATQKVENTIFLHPAAFVNRRDENGARHRK